MNRLVHFNPYALSGPKREDPRDIILFKKFCKLFKSRHTFIDRTGTIKIPIHTKSFFPLPAYQSISKNLEDICNERARLLLERAESLAVPLYTLWSGGIDSTLVLVSLLKNATREQKKNIVVLLSEDSIAENPNFYRDHIHHNLRRGASESFSRLLGRDGLVVSGEHNDQLFGADTIGQLLTRFGASMLQAPYNRDLMLTFYSERTDDSEMPGLFVEILDRLIAAAPRDIVSNHDAVWWFSFVLKWQSVYFRTLAFAGEVGTRRFAERNPIEQCLPFYDSDDFQLWAMSNPDMKIKNTWNTYKWPCKDIIYNFTKDTFYRDTKLKNASLRSVVDHMSPVNFIDEHMNFSYEYSPTKYYSPINDFAER